MWSKLSISNRRGPVEPDPIAFNIRISYSRNAAGYLAFLGDKRKGYGTY